MPLSDPDTDRWMDELPLEWMPQVVAPVRFERHEDSWAHARKFIGRDPQGQPCWIEHVHTEVEERFDIDEFPLQVALGRERRVAWRLQDGRWLLQVDRLDRLDSCRPRLHHTPAAPVEVQQLGL
jgi:hypothetical protein